VLQLLSLGLGAWTSHLIRKFGSDERDSEEKMLAMYFISPCTQVFPEVTDAYAIWLRIPISRQVAHLPLGFILLKRMRKPSHHQLYPLEPVLPKTLRLPKPSIQGATNTAVVFIA
jgi:hypothetical protein